MTDSVRLTVEGFPEQLVMTSGHRVKTADGFKKASDLRQGNKIYVNSGDSYVPRLVLGIATNREDVKKERPMLFSGPMVRAILAGTKTQTRRIINVQPTNITKGGDEFIFANLATIMKDGWIVDDSACGRLKCPYGKSGDRLWVRETFMRCEGDVTVYAADCTPEEVKEGTGAWAPSIFMPRSRSRITLEITEVRAERLQDISREDAKDEGLTFVADGGTRFGIPGIAATWNDDSRIAYKSLWESINGRGSWDANPWVWAVTFKRIK